MDDTQYDRRYTNRNIIVDPHGPVWLTVPINKSQKFSPNRLVEINNGISWKEDHWRKIRLSYSNARFFHLYRELEWVYDKEWRRLFDLNLETIKKTMGWLGIKIPVIKESELHLKGESTERLVRICRSVGADTYVSGAGGKGYIQERLFEENKLKLEYQDYAPTPYSQRFVSAFVPNLSILDMLFNVGPDSMNLISGITNPLLSA
jgi:hypothetical protein